MPDSAPGSHVEDARIAEIATTPVKGLALASPTTVRLDATGIATDRAFFLIDEGGRMVNGKALGELVRVTGHVDDPPTSLTVRFPDGSLVSGHVVLGPEARVRFYRHEFMAPTVDGPWSAALSEFCGRPLRLCRAPASRPGVDRGVRGGVTLMSEESLAALADAGRLTSVDGRRFRMTFTVSGAGPHAEDRWIGSEISVGSAVVRVHGLVGRCSVTTRNPDTGAVDLPTLHILNAYRGDVPSDEGLPFGVYGEVVRPGEVRVGDPVHVGGGNWVAPEGGR
jgi:uncharacterized protein YcbX